MYRFNFRDVLSNMFFIYSVNLDTSPDTPASFQDIFPHPMLQVVEAKLWKLYA